MLAKLPQKNSIARCASGMYLKTLCPTTVRKWIPILDAGAEVLSFCHGGEQRVSVLGGQGRCLLDGMLPLPMSRNVFAPFSIFYCMFCVFAVYQAPHVLGE